MTTFTTYTLVRAVSVWSTQPYNAIRKWGPIEDWDTSQVTNMSYLFCCDTAFSEDLSKWDTSQVTNMAHMFHLAVSFSADLSKWDVSQVTDMRYMFNNAGAFSSDLSNWNTSRVANMSHLFYGATSFSSDLSRWNTENVHFMDDMLTGTITQRVWGVHTLEDISIHPLYPKSGRLHALMHVPLECRRYWSISTYI